MGGKNKTSFKKGEVHNPNGRPRGTKDKKTEQWHQLGEYLLNDGAQRYRAVLNGLGDKEFAERFERILEYFKPKQQRTEISGAEKTGVKKITFHKGKD